MQGFPRGSFFEGVFGLFLPSSRLWSDPRGAAQRLHCKTLSEMVQLIDTYAMFVVKGDSIVLRHPSIPCPLAQGGVGTRLPSCYRLSGSFIASRPSILPASQARPEIHTCPPIESLFHIWQNSTSRQPLGLTLKSTHARRSKVSFTFDRAVHLASLSGSP